MKRNLLLYDVTVGTPTVMELARNIEHNFTLLDLVDKDVLKNTHKYVGKVKKPFYRKERW